MKLTEVNKNTYLIIERVLYEDAKEESTLNNFGLISGERIELLDLNSFKKAFFIRIGDNQFYINEPLAKRIEVKYE